MQDKRHQPFLHRTKRKVIAAFVLACTAIILSLGIAYLSLSELLEKVDAVSTPNEKIQILNRFFRQVTRVEQKHRAEAIKNPQRASEKILEESQALMLTLDSLMALPWTGEQAERLLAMEEILRERNRLFFRYLRERSVLSDNKNYLHQLDSLSEFLLHYSPDPDSSIFTTQQKTTTTTYLPPSQPYKDDRSFFSRLFNSKRNTEIDPLIEIREELSIITDTVAIIRQDSAIEQIGKIMLSLEEAQRTQHTQLVERELDLIEASTNLLNQLVNILHDVENEEVAALQVNHALALSLVNSSVNRTIVVIILFFLALGVLVFFILGDLYRSQYYRKQLEEAKDQAEQLRQVKERFLANMSHEIRTPLQSIIGFAEQFEETGNPREALEAIQSSSEHLLHIVNEVLDYSRIESGKFVLEREPFNLKVLLREVEAGIRLQAAKKGLAFIVETNGVKNINLLGDSFRLSQILYNLLGNAIKFTEKGFVKLLVTAHDTGYRMNCRFVVQDTGIGIHQQDLNRVFQHFEQANNAISHRYGGTGLGLTIVKALVDAQYGELKAESDPGSGTTFTVLLGFDKAPLSAVAKNIFTPSFTVQKSFKGHVLVIDDDPLILKVCSLILTKHTIQHTLVQQPERLLRHLPSQPITHVFLDIRMPHVNGVELCSELKKQLPSSTRFIALTAHVLPEEQDNFKKHGFDDILTKPFREHELLNMLGVLRTNESHHTYELFDPSVLNQLTLGDTDLYQEVVDQFCSDTSADLIALENCTRIDDTKNGREIIHKLAGRTGQIGAHDLSQQFSAMEGKLHFGGHILEMSDLIQAASAATKKLMETLQQKLAVE
jgi:signal transduction histidine kinase/DNA-binding response OmpR family regulator